MYVTKEIVLEAIKYTFTIRITILLIHSDIIYCDTKHAYCHISSS